MWHSSCHHHTLTVAPLTINTSPNNHHGSQHQPTPGWWTRGAQRSTVKWVEMQIHLVLVISLRYVLRFTSFSIPLLCLTLRTSFSFTLTFSIYSYMLTLVLTLAQSAQPCTVRAASHSSFTVHTQPCTVNAQPCTVHVSWYINPYVTSLFFS